ncbi:MAG: lytic murein transglycosylase [Pseudomonadota bacterium]
MFRVLAATILLALPLGATASDFAQWLENTAWPAARAEGVTRTNFERLTRDLTPDYGLPGLSADGTVPAIDSQAEFAAPAGYFSENNLASLAAAGRRLAGQYAAPLARIERDYGVPAHIILAIWGRESAYGRASIPHDALSVLATRGFAGTRRATFTAEFAAALRIKQETGLTLRSSWAGALGQPQFLPSSYLQYAADGDGDGTADIWGSVPDTLASIANYLAKHGYDGARDWGFEVAVPASVSCTSKGPDRGKPIQNWESAGITRISGRAFPQAERRGEGYLLMPAGRQGPAFIVTPNFYVLKEYNESDLYALFVGNLGDRIAYGSPAFRAPWGRTDAMTRGQIARAQRTLEAQGYDVGGADGLIGFKTRRAVGAWQARSGRPQTCFPNAALIRELGG